MGLRFSKSPWGRGIKSVRTPFQRGFDTFGTSPGGPFLILFRTHLVPVAPLSGSGRLGEPPPEDGYEDWEGDVGQGEISVPW